MFPSEILFHKYTNASLSKAEEEDSLKHKRKEQFQMKKERVWAKISEEKEQCLSNNKHTHS